jgi:hypothetical protein
MYTPMSSSQYISRRRPRTTFSSMCLGVILCSRLTLAFISPSPFSIGNTAVRTRQAVPASEKFSSASSTSLNVWWFGGTEQSELTGNDDSCELVAVRIERTSANSRRIAGDITVEAPLEDVWAILTDYNRLSIHVPNLMESKILSRGSAGEQGDGSFRCRLFQKGSQKIIGFDFSATVTMDMAERIIQTTGSPERKIAFKCAESQFFSEFDGEWRVKEQNGPDGQPETVVTYMVDVRPKGPVPVGALEWRIREDVPTNLRAVKAASLKTGQAGVLAAREGRPIPRQLPITYRNGAADNGANRQGSNEMNPTPALVIPGMLDWDRDETMAKYL